MSYRTSRFGDITVPDDKILTFPSGVIGFEKLRSFVILKHKPDSSFFWLQSLENPDLAFSLLFPFEVLFGYNPIFPPSELTELKVQDPKELEIYTTVVIPKDPTQLTLNLMSPIVVNPKEKIGRQIVLVDSMYSVKHRLGDPLPATSEKPVRAG